jgi:hypothetical protein
MCIASRTGQIRGKYEPAKPTEGRDQVRVSTGPAQQRRAGSIGWARVSMLEKVDLQHVTYWR